MFRKVKFTKTGNVYMARLRDGRKWYVPEPDKTLALWAVNLCSNVERYLDVVRPGDVVVDVGACTGEYTVEALKRVGQTGMVYAIEPDVRASLCIHLNCEMNKLKNFRTISFPVSDKIERVDYKVNRNISGAYIEPGTQLQAFTLSDMRFERRPTVLKITVNGNEISVLKGANRMLGSIRHIVFQTQFCSGLKYWLHEYGFKIQHLIPANDAPYGTMIGLAKREG